MYAIMMENVVGANLLGAGQEQAWQDQARRRGAPLLAVDGISARWNVETERAPVE